MRGGEEGPGAGGRTAPIEISLANVRQLYATLDPAPFRQKDLSTEAEAYIVDSAREFALSRPVKLILHLPEDAAATPEAAELPASIHFYFDFCFQSGRRRLREFLRVGWVSLAIGIAFLFGCITLREVVLATPDTAVEEIVAEGLLISGWVAMWRPLQIFLYDWWPIHRANRLYDKLRQMPVEIRPSATDSDRR